MEIKTKKMVRIGYMDSCADRTMKLLTADAFKELLKSDKVRQTMNLIEAEPDAEKKSKLKQRLPVVLFACQMTENGERPTAQNNLVKASGFCLHDWDHMPTKPAQFYMENIAGREDELGLVLAHITPRGEGLRLVTVMKTGEDIATHQRQLAEKFGMEKFADPKVYDLTRLSFLPSADYIIYQNEKRLFEHEIEDVPSPSEAFKTTSAPETITPPGTVEMGAKEGATPDIAVTPPEAKNLAESMEFKGLKFSSIIELLENRVASSGKISEGQRNDVLYAMARELRHICGYNFETLYSFLVPYFKTLPDNEIRKTITSALNSSGRQMTPFLIGIINELKQFNSAVEENDVLLPKLPKLSAVEEMILSHYPQHLRNQVFMAMLPIWGVYGTHIRFEYLDGKTNSLSFMTAIVGKSGSGKGFAANLFDKMMGKFMLEDSVERAKANEYVEKYNESGESGQKPKDPHSRIRIFGDDITTSQLLEYLDNLKGEHGIQFTEEIARLNKAKHSIYGDNDDLYCKAFDNSVGGKESKSKMTRNIRIPIFLNTLFCGTPEAMHKFYSNPEGGLNNRVIFAFMPNVRLRTFPKYTKFSESDQALFDEVTERLWHSGEDGQMLEYPWLEKVIMSIKNKWDKDDQENPDEVWYDLGKRAMAVAMRVGVLQWYLRGCPSADDRKEIMAIGRVVRWIADAMRKGIYDFCGSEYEKLNNADNAIQTRGKYNSKNKKLFSVLANEFTANDVIAQRIQNGDSATCVGTILSRWTSDGQIERIGENRYRKIG